MSPDQNRGRAGEARRNDHALLDAARRLVARDGPGASVADIAREAGVGIASLYRRYATKEDLLAHLCLTSMAEFAVAARTALNAEDAGGGLRGLVEAACSAEQGSSRQLPTA
jgi:AcrR family transcriptional regulator